MSDVKYKTIKENKVGIIGQNVLVNNNIVTAFYIVDSLNYSTMATMGIRRHIDRLESLATTLGTQMPGLKFSIFNVNKVLTPEDIKKNMIDTVRLWDPSYDRIPEIFDKYVTKSNRIFTILAVQIETSNMGDIESVTLKSILKEYINRTSQYLFSYSNVNVDAKRILDAEKFLYNIIRSYGVRASRELTFYTYVSSLFPSYEISYDKNSYVEKNLSSILGAVKQEVKAHFGGYFEMSNVGVELFNLPAQTTYGSVINILELPDKIDSDNFNLQIEGLRVNIETIPRDKAKLTMKRSRADIEFEEESASNANLRRRDMEYLEEHKEMANTALDNIDQGKMICKMNASILVLARSVEELKAKRQAIISKLADIKIIASPSLSQETAFINNFVKLAPFSNEYNHICDIRYPLSFQLDSGVQVGDSDSGFESPSIGESL